MHTYSRTFYRRRKRKHWIDWLNYWSCRRTQILRYLWSAAASISDDWCTGTRSVWSLCWVDLETSLSTDIDYADIIIIAKVQQFTLCTTWLLTKLKQQYNTACCDSFLFHFAVFFARTTDWQFMLCTIRICIFISDSQFLANVNSRSRSLYAIARPSVCRLSSVCL